MKYVVTVRQWDYYAGEGGEWVWKVLHTLEGNEVTLEIIENGLRALGLAYAIGKVEGAP